MSLNYKIRLAFILQPEESQQFPFRGRMTHSDSLENLFVRDSDGNDVVTPSPWLVDGFIVVANLMQTAMHTSWVFSTRCSKDLRGPRASPSSPFLNKSALSARYIYVVSPPLPVDTVLYPLPPLPFPSLLPFLLTSLLLLSQELGQCSTPTLKQQ